MQKILAFCFFPAFMPPQSGGVSRLFHIYQELSQHFQVTLLTSTHASGPDERIHHGTNFVELRVAKDSFFNAEWKRLTPFAGEGDLSAPTLAACGVYPTRLHEVYMQEYADADIIIHDFPFMVDYDVFAGLDHKPRIYNAHNCETLLYQKLHPEAKSKPIHDLVQRCEQKLLNLADAVWYCGEDDLNAFQQLASQAKFQALYVPNGATPLPSLHTSVSISPPRAVFLGSGHLPNVEAARFIIDQLAPSVPDWHFDLVGSCWAQPSALSNVTVHGVVDSATKRRLLHEATLALNPMQSGSGSNVKVLDYFAHGVPVLSTPMGMRGIDALNNEQVWLGELPQFAACLTKLMVEPVQLKKVAQAATRLLQQRYSWAAVVRPAVQQLKQLVAAPKPVRPYVLVLNDYDSYALIGGGCVRTQGIYDSVSQHYAVVFMCFSRMDQLRVRVINDKITVLEVPKTAAHIRQLDQDNSRCSPISVNDIVASQHVCANPWLSAIYQGLRTKAYAIVTEHVYMAPLPLAHQDRFIYSSHNHEGDLKTKMLPDRGADLAQYVVELEQKAVAKAVATLAVSESDAQLLSRGDSAGPIFIVPNGSLAPEISSPEHLQKVGAEVQSPSAVFLGSGHLPNAEAARFIVQQLAPACPQVQFHLIGSVCDAVHSLPTNVKAWGMVDESLKTAIMSQATLALNPMSSGSGSNIKLADFIGNGLFTVTTPFGARGYPDDVVAEHTQVVDLVDFAQAIQQLCQQAVNTDELRAQRQQIFIERLSMQAQAQRFVRFLQTVNQPRKRMLLVTYRYTSPSLGGAEQHIEYLLRAADASGQYQIDVVAPQVTRLETYDLYREKYIYEEETEAFTDLEHTRFHRFPVDGNDDSFWRTDLEALWLARIGFERSVTEQLMQKKHAQTGLAWGWGYMETGLSGKAYRWGFVDCAIYVSSGSNLYLQAEAFNDLVLTVTDSEGQLVTEQSCRGKFSLELSNLPEGPVRFFSSMQLGFDKDPRPLAFKLLQCRINEMELDLKVDSICQVRGLEAKEGFEVLHQAMAARQRVRLTDVRGPWSSGLERYLQQYIQQYDVVLTHNTVFRPPVAALGYAKQAGVPAVVIPHAHLDDDYYHFPDVLTAAQDAALVLAVPKAACQYFTEQGCQVQYLPAGIDAHESFSEQDVVAFKEVFKAADSKPFVLVLGRKSPVKGYQTVLEAAERLQGKIHVVLIGPDDDGVKVDSPYATYLGRQPRNVLRGALQSCLALTTMSRSESFGIVLLEAWLAGRPVIANTHCAAFHDMAVHKHNALLVDETTLAEAMLYLLEHPEVANQLGQQGRELTAQYDWATISQQFLQLLSQLEAK